MHLYIMRHGETFWNKKGLIQGSSDIANPIWGRTCPRYQGRIRPGRDKISAHLFQPLSACRKNSGDYCRTSEYFRKGGSPGT